MAHYLFTMPRDPSYEELQDRVRHLEGLLKGAAESSETVENSLLFLRTLLDSIPMPVFYKTADGIYQNCNAAFAERILGHPAEEIMGKSLFDFEDHIPKDLAQRYHAKDNELIEHPGTQIYEARVQRSDGSLGDYIFYKASLKDVSGRATGIIGIMLDISVRKEAERRLKESEERSRTLMEATANGIGIHQNGIILDANEGLTRITGYDFEELIGMDGLLLFTPEERDRVRKKLPKAMNNTTTPRG